MFNYLSQFFMFINCKVNVKMFLVDIVNKNLIVYGSGSIGSVKKQFSLVSKVISVSKWSNREEIIFSFSSCIVRISCVRKVKFWVIKVVMVVFMVFCWGMNSRLSIRLRLIFMVKMMFMGFRLVLVVRSVLYIYFLFMGIKVSMSYCKILLEQVLLLVQSVVMMGVVKK